MSIEERRAALEAYLAKAAGEESASIERVAKLSGGAIQENHALDVVYRSGCHVRNEKLVLRTDSPSGVAVSHSRANEFALLRAAHRAGVRVPEPFHLCEDRSVLGRPFFVMEYRPGVAAGHRLVKDDALVPDRAALARAIGRDMARLHTIEPGSDELAFLRVPETSPALEFVDQYRRHLDALPEPAPAYELGLRWCERNAPPTDRVTLVHRDYRTGNYLVHEGELSAVLDWEFAGFGDPVEDVGWFFAKCWRFGRDDRRAGGIGPAEAFLEGYREVSGIELDPRAIHFWEVVAHLRWGIIAMQQAERHLSRQQPSLELALTGRIPSEVARTMLALVKGGRP